MLINKQAVIPGFDERKENTGVEWLLARGLRVFCAAMLELEAQRRFLGMNATYLRPLYIP